MKKRMKPITLAALSLATAGLLASNARAEVVQREVTETTTVTGTVSDVAPSSRIVVTSNGTRPHTRSARRRSLLTSPATW